MDANKNKNLDLNELDGGLRLIGINLNEEQCSALLKYFDKDGSGTINFNEFLNTIRGDLNESRLGWVKKAYAKLDVNGDGTVTLDDIAKLYDVSKHPEIVNGSMTPKEVFMQYMSLWDTQVPDGIITMDEFCDYYRDVSASIDSDEYFGVMMTAAWKL